MKTTLLAFLGITALAVVTSANVQTNQEREESVMKTIQILEAVDGDEKLQYTSEEPTLIIEQGRKIKLKSPYEGEIKSVFSQYELHPIATPELIEALAWVESRWNPEAKSGTGPVGVMQTTKYIWEKFSDYPLEDRTIPYKSLEVGTKLVDYLAKRFYPNVTETNSQKNLQKIHKLMEIYYDGEKDFLENGPSMKAINHANAVVKELRKYYD